MTEEESRHPTLASYTMPLRVRHSDADELGHVGNPVYLVYATEAAYRHAESVGFTLERMREMGGVFVVRRSEIEYRHAAKPGDELLVTTTLTVMHGLRANRATRIVLADGGRLVATASTDYIWVNNQGRPAHIPAEALAFFGMA